MASGGTGPAVVVVGNLTIDDVVHADGSTHMGALGGNTIHAAVGARTWGVGVGVVARAGDDFPSSGLERLSEAGIDTGGIRPVAGPTVRNWVVYEPDGRRTWVHRTPGGRPAEVAPSPDDLPEQWLSSRPVWHVAAMPFAAARRLVRAIRSRAGGPVTLDTHEDWSIGFDDALEVARQVAVFVPSREELAAIIGFDDPEGAARRLVDAGVGHVVVKCGGDGALVAGVGLAPTWVPAAAVAVADPTGAGDSFCGGLAAGLALGEAPIDAVRRGCATAGAAIGASGSLRLLDRRDLAEGLLRAGSPPPLRQPAAGGVEDDSDIMEREIASIPAVTLDRVALSGRAAPVVERLVESKAERLVLVGCGDSSFATQAAALAFARCGVRAHWEHALDFARYSVRYLPERTAVVILSYSGRTGRPLEAAHQARAFGHLTIGLTGNPTGPLAGAVDMVLPAEVPTFGMSPGTSTYTAMLVTLLTLAQSVGEAAGLSPAAAERYRADLERLPSLAEGTIDLNREPSLAAASRLLGARITTFLGAGPNEATAKFGAAKLFEGAQQLATVTNIEEWAHEQYFVTRPGDPVVLVAPSGASLDRAGEVLDELAYVRAATVWVSDVAPPGEAVHLPLAPGAPEELSPVLAALPVSQVALHLMRQSGRRSYNFPDEAARREHYETIHRATIGEPA